MADLVQPWICDRRARTGAVLLAVLLACAAFASPSLAGVSAGNWDLPQQRQVVKDGLMEPAGAGFNGSATLSAGQANAAMAALAASLQSAAGETAPDSGEAGIPAAGEQAATSAAAVPVAHTWASPVTVVTFDRMLVEQLGLAETAAQVQSGTAAAGLHPPAYFGSEVVARMLELRFEHSVGTQRLDLSPTDPITRAEAAWSLAAAVHLSGWGVSSTREQLSGFELPAMSSAERQALRIAVSRIGFPYIWGGTTDDTSDGLEHGGFDCSGFAWRVFKVSGLAWGARINGRTAAEQAGEIPRRARVPAAQLKPGDLLFFGSAHFNSRATERNVIHEGIYLGDNWVIHSSGQGVYVLPLKGGWLGDQFAWGRRVIG